MQPAVLHTLSCLKHCIYGKRKPDWWLLVKHTSHRVPFLFVLSLASPLETRNDSHAATKILCSHQVPRLQPQVSQLHFTCKTMPEKHEWTRTMTNSDEIDRNSYLFQERDLRHGQRWCTPGCEQEKTDRALQSQRGMVFPLQKAQPWRRSMSRHFIFIQRSLPSST
jgi:hypothetical protein